MTGKKSTFINKTNYLTVFEFDFFDDYIDKKTINWKKNIKDSLGTICALNNLGRRRITKGSLKKRLNLKKIILSEEINVYEIVYPQKAFDILKEKMSSHPENFDNGKMLKW